MKIRQYILTYRNSDILNNCLKSIFDGLSVDELNMLEIFIINNHSDFYIEEHYTSKVKVLHNVLRPELSLGHSARHWNEALMHGFKDLRDPDCDIVITNQNDVIFKPNYINSIIKFHEKYDLLQFGVGDACVSYVPNAVKRIGMWDERFCNLGYQEMEYLIRAHIYHRERVAASEHVISIRTPTEYSILEDTITGAARSDKYHLEGMKYYWYTKNLLFKKWEGWHGIDDPLSWYEENISPKIDSYFIYPYFELGIDCDVLKKQKYVGIEAVCA